MNPFFGEFFGTAIIILLGGGVVANVSLDKTNGASEWLDCYHFWVGHCSIHRRAFCSPNQRRSP